MAIELETAMKSGKGTSMTSRRGKSTINVYKCFQRDPEEEKIERRLMMMKLLFGYPKKTLEDIELEEEQAIVASVVAQYNAHLPKKKEFPGLIQEEAVV